MDPMLAENWCLAGLGAARALHRNPFLAAEQRAELASLPPAVGQSGEL